MSSALPRKPRTFTAKSTICIIVSRYNPEYTQALLNHCEKELEDILPTSSIIVLETPGSFEVPVTVQHALDKYQPDIIIAFGVILRGATAHADLIAASITNSLQEIAVRSGKPIIHEVLLLNDIEQAKERCLDLKLNRGVEAARAACAMAELFEIGKNKAGLGNKGAL